MNHIDILGITILEPIVSLTDVTTGLISLWIYSWLNNKEFTANAYVQFKRFFLLLGVATICAGILGHGLLHYLHKDWKLIGWVLSALALFQLQIGSIRLVAEHLGRKPTSYLLALTVLQTILFFAFVSIPVTRSFNVVLINSAFGFLLVLLPLYLTSYYRWNQKGTLTLAAGILLMISMSFIHKYQIGLHQWIDHNTVNHLIMTSYVLLVFNALKTIYPGLREPAVK